jgi:hypothetical protein
VSYTFTKLFSSITESTIWVEPHPVRITWITMLAMADRQGRVFASIPGLANRARVTVEEAEKAIERFLSPDHYSRTPDNEGRRIEPIDGGWRLLNHAKYRALQDEETIKESKRKWWHENKEQLEKTRKARSPSIQAEAEADAEADTDKNKDSSVGQVLHPTALPLRKGEEFKIPETLITEWSKIYPKVDIPATILEMRGWCLSNPSRLKTRRGALRFVNNWLRTAQEEYAQG